MSISLRVLIIDDSEDDAALLMRELQHSGYDVAFERVDTPDEMRVALAKQTWDVILADYTMPQFSGPAALKLLKEKGIDLPFIFVSGTMGEEAAVAAMKMGAHDYIMKGSLKRLVPAIERELREAQMRRERKRAEEKIQHLAYYDVLTDLPNRSVFYDRLQQAILAGHRETKPLAVLILDLNRFKEINDAFGHHYGDLLLQQIGPRLRSCLRDSDTVARMGGDEFASLLPNANIEGAALAARKILKELEAPYVLEGAALEVKASIGIALFPDHGEDADLLVQRADIAMYVTKQAGGGYVVYTPEQDQQSNRQLALKGKLRHAIEYEEMVLRYQPKLSIQTNQVIGVEALTSWRHPQLGTVLPDQFIPVAEQTGLIKPLTQWVLKEAYRQCREWHQAGLDLPVSVNLSARNLQEVQLPDQIAELFQTNQVGPSFLELEIAESAIMADPVRAMQILARLAAMGIQLSIDDFGTGYSSLSYLKRLPVQKIKIDKSFVVNRVQEEEDVVIVISMINMAHNLGLKVVAKGVENQETMDRLKALSCDEVQGYHISRPLPAAEVTRWLHDSPWKSQ
jgi:diguanylate cyclase (GGDEF)-like protein